MKKAKKKTIHSDPADDSELDYDYVPKGPRVRGKYAARFPAKEIVVLLDPALAMFFPTSEKVKEGLRELLLLKMRPKRRRAT